MKTKESLLKLSREIGVANIKQAKREWGGADVIITKNKPRKSNNSFYPAPRFVITEYSLELSWLFEELRDAFYSESLIDGYSKIEFFGRLANTANRYILGNLKITAQELCAAVLHEGYAIYEEIIDGNFKTLPIAIGNEIADDYINEAERSGFIGIDKTIEFFKSHGVEINNA
jgi:hypothetical protein